MTLTSEVAEGQITESFLMRIYIFFFACFASVNDATGFYINVEEQESF